VLGAFVPDVSEDMAFVAAFAMGGAQSSGNGRRLVDCSEQLANGLGIVKCVSISQMNVRRWWFAYSGWTKCNRTRHVAVNGYVSTRVSDVSVEGGHGLEEGGISLGMTVELFSMC